MIYGVNVKKTGDTGTLFDDYWLGRQGSLGMGVLLLGWEIVQPGKGRLEVGVLD